jgi:hypothetical protein
MSNDGFRASVRIDEIKICAGKHKAQPYDNAFMEMTGVILECDEPGVHMFSSGSKRKKTSVSVYINSYPTPDFSEHVPDELSEQCIGQMVVRIRNEKVKKDRVFDKYDIRAQIHLVLNYDTFDKLVALKDSTIFVEPIFFREQGEKEKKTEVEEAGGIRSFIERVYFSPYIKTNET